MLLVFFFFSPLLMFCLFLSLQLVRRSVQKGHELLWIQMLFWWMHLISGKLSLTWFIKLLLFILGATPTWGAKVKLNVAMEGVIIKRTFCQLPYEIAPLNPLMIQWKIIHHRWGWPLKCIHAYCHKSVGYYKSGSGEKRESMISACLFALTEVW